MLNLINHAAAIFWYNSDPDEKSEDLEKVVTKFTRRPKLEDFKNRTEEIFVVSGPPMFNKFITMVANSLKRKVIVL